MSDPIPINAEDVARYHAAINAIIERYVVDMYRTSVPAVTSVGNLHIAWNLRRGRVYKDLIESRATWGEFNRARRILVLELALATRAVFAIQGQPGSASLVR